MTNQDSTEKGKSVQFTFRVSEDLWLLMEQLIQKEKHPNISDFVRTCIRAYLDEKSDAIGSKRHFTRSLAERMDRLEAMLLWNSLQSQVMTARGMFTVLDELAPEDAAEEPPTPDIQLSRALETSKRLLPQFLEEQGKIVRDLEEYRRKQGRAKA
jgi:Arc/MetJ-type ribon-helix-helix transcriptional regulator